MYTDKCLDCDMPLTEAQIRKGQRYCCTSHSIRFNNMMKTRGASIYSLVRILRRERDTATRLNIWTELCRVELSWNDQDAGRKTWKPAEMALADIEAMDRKPTTNLYVKGK
mgnify:CR=1 FL=1